MDAKIRLRRGQLKKYRAMTGLASDVDLAKRMGVARQTVSRAINGQHELSARFVAALLAVFPHLTFDDLFEVLPTDEQKKAA